MKVKTFFIFCCKIFLQEVKTVNFPEILKELREEKNVTRTTVALNCNVSTQCISSLEMGTRNPTSSTLMALADYFNCSIDYLMGRENALEDSIFSTPPAPLPQDEQELLSIYQALSPTHRSQILEYARYFAEKSGAASTRRKA